MTLEQSEVTENETDSLKKETRKRIREQMGNYDLETLITVARTLQISLPDHVKIGYGSFTTEASRKGNYSTTQLRNLEYCGITGAKIEETPRLQEEINDQLSQLKASGNYARFRKPLITALERALSLMDQYGKKKSQEKETYKP